MSQLLQNAAYGTAMILAVMVLRRALKERLAPGARLALWGACLFRLLTPAAPESVLSLWGLVGRLDVAEMGAQSAPAAPVPGPVYTPGPELPAVPPAPIDASGALADAPRAAFPWGTALTAVWLAVGVAVGLWYAVGWVRARRAVACAIPVERDDPQYRARYRFLPRFARLREGPVEGAPLTFGALRPTVVLTPGLEGEELVCVLAHEGVHARRRDNLWHYVMAAALTVHWWNPAVWLMARLLRRDIELACDRAAVKLLGEERRADYAQALVTLSTQGSGAGPAFSQSFGRKATEERIRSIMKFKKPTVIGVILTLVLVLGVTIAFASDPKTAPDEDSATSSAPAAQRWSVRYDGDGSMKDLSINLDYLEENLAQYVADGSMNQRDAAYYLDAAKNFSEDGKALVWSFQDEMVLKLNENREICRQDRDGNLIPLDAVTLVRDFIFPGRVDGQPQFQGGCSFFEDGNVVTRAVISLEALEEDLGIRVEENTIFKAEAELIMAQAQSIAVDGVIDWTFPEDNGLRYEELPEESTEDTTVGAHGYWDKDGKFVVVSISEIVYKFILPQALMGEDAGTLFDISDYTVVEPEIDEQGNSIVRDEDGNLVLVGIRTSSGVEFPCKEPGCQVEGAHAHDKDGKVISVHYQMPGLLCTRAGCMANGAHTHEGVSYDACAATLTPEQYASALSAWVSLDAMTQAEADEWLEIFRTLYDRVQEGEADAFSYNIYDGTRLVPAFYKSERVAAGYPVNSKGETYGPNMPEVYGSSPDLVLAQGTKGEVGYIRESEAGHGGYPGTVNNPEEAMAYMEWLKTQPATIYVPLYDSEGNEIGQFALGNSQAAESPSASAGAVYPVCDVEGCTMEGCHVHDGVTYCGGAAHYGKTCDGSCIYQTQQMVIGGSSYTEEPVSCPPEAIDQSVSTGHHGESHHSDSHH